MCSISPFPMESIGFSVLLSPLLSIVGHRRQLALQNRHLPLQLRRLISASPDPPIDVRREGVDEMPSTCQQVLQDPRCGRSRQRWVRLEGLVLVAPNPPQAPCRSIWPLYDGRRHHRRWIRCGLGRPLLRSCSLLPLLRLGRRILRLV